MSDPDRPDFQERLAEFESDMFAELRPGQRLVLDEYADKHVNTPDVAIEMPTGQGKTLVALLIADYALEQGLSVAYLTENRQLAEKVQQQAELLGLEVVRFASRDYGARRLDDYHQAQKPAVMNYWVYFNSNPTPNPADVVIFDDAHLAEQPLTGLRTLRIPNKTGAARELYSSICDLVLAHTGDTYPAVRTMREGVAAPGTPPELLSFVDWADVSEPIRGAINASEYAETNEFKFVWRSVQDYLPRCGVLIGPSAIEVRPYHPLTQLIPGYAESKHRIYLSATLGTMDDLQRRIGGKQIVQLTPPAALPVGATGVRKLVLNPTGQPAMSDDVLEWVFEQVEAAGGRAAWLCASNAEADELEKLLDDEGEKVFRLRAGNDDEVDQWVAADRGHLVTAGRYDGLDLPGDVCELVIVTTVPQASSEYERFVVAYLGDATFMRHRVGQRITQALGRANRTETDRAMYLALDPTFAQMLADPAVRKSIPADVTPVIGEALDLFEEGWEATQEACEAFWDNGSTDAGAVEEEPDPETPAPRPARRARARPGRSTGGAADVHSAPDEVAASTSLWLGDHGTAVSSAQAASAGLAEAGQTEHSAFWRYVQAHAHFNGGRDADRVAARAALAEAIEKGPQTAWFRRLARTSAQLEGNAPATDDNDRLFLAWEEFRREAGGRLEAKLTAGRAALLGNHDQQCDGLLTLARLAGADGHRPGKREQAATDCRWSWATAKKSQRRAWEVKTAEKEGAERKFKREDVNQLLGQLVVEGKLAPKAKLSGCLVDPATEAHPDAVDAASDRIRLVSHEALVTLYDLLADRLRTYVARCEDGTAEARGEARAHVEKMLPSGDWLTKLLAPSPLGDVLRSDDVTAIFPAG